MFLRVSFTPQGVVEIVIAQDRRSLSSVSALSALALQVLIETSRRALSLAFLLLKRIKKIAMILSEWLAFFIGSPLVPMRKCPEPSHIEPPSG